MRSPITVIGSLNMDLVVEVQRLPRPGETILGGGLATLPGGKGANQAFAAAKLGGSVRMVGRVGRDAFGEALRQNLASAGVDTSAVLASEAASGTALIVVETGGQNQIVVAPGANAALEPADVERALPREGFLLLQLESPLATIEAAAALGSARGLTVVLDPAPARALPDALLAHVSCLTPNESEALALLGRAPSAIDAADAPRIARALRRRGPRIVILKLGEQGAFVDDGVNARHFPAPRVAAVDATAAGDTFNGALAVALSDGRPLPEAVAFANRAAALSVTRRGAQASIPTRAEVDARLAG